MFQAAFEDEFDVLSAGSAAEALEILDTVQVPVVVADQRMPEMSGVELFAVMRRRHPHIQRILLTAYSDPDAMIDAINKGQVFHFVKKPWNRYELRSILLRALETHDLLLRNAALADRLLISDRCAMLGQATARIVHEMGNQLGIVPLLEFIEDRFPEDKDLVNVMRFARQTHDRLVELIEEIKAFMRFDGEEVSVRPVPLVEAVCELVGFLRFDEAVPSERFHLEINSEPVVLAHRVKLQQVLANVIKNAADAIQGSPNGSIKVAVDRVEQQAVLQVSDNGCGMDAATLDRIWEPFFTTKGGNGNGLGLDIARRLIECQGGRISCTSAPQKGSTFVIRLPLASDSIDGQRRRESSDQRSAVGNEREVPSVVLTSEA